MSIVDSSDASQIEYHPTADAPWYLLVSTMQDGNIYNNSLSVIYGQGSAIFRFTGSRVDVYGTEMPEQNGAMAVSHYTLDQQVPVVHVSSAGWVTEHDTVNFYSSGEISYGAHVLVINVTEASTSTPYYLDFIAYIDADTSISSSYSSYSPSSLSSLSFSFSTLSTAAATSTAATSTTDTGLPTITTTSVVEKSNNVNVIVGGVIGGAVGLIAIILAIFFFCFGRRVLQRYTARKRDLQSELPTEATEDVTSYIASDLGSSPHMSEAQSGEHPSLYPHEATRGSFTLAPEDSAWQAGLGTFMNSPSAPRLSASRKSGMPPPIASEPPATHHADSGLRFRSEATSSGVAPADIPPVYTPN